MKEIVSVGVAVDRFYAVIDVEPVPDSARCPLDPSEVTVRFRAYANSPLRATYVTVKGRRLRGAKTKGTFNQGGYSVLPDGTVEPDYKTGAAPAWVQEIVTQSIAEHAAGVGLVPVAA